MRKFGLSFFRRQSGDGFTLASRHPPSSPTWYWALSWQPAKADFARHILRLNIDKGRGPHQRHHRLHLMRAGCLMLSTQAYHKQSARPL